MRNFVDIYHITIVWQLAVANPKWQVIQKMKLANFVDKIGRDRIFLTVGEAIEGCLGAKLASSPAVI